MGLHIGMSWLASLKRKKGKWKTVLIADSQGYVVLGHICFIALECLCGFTGHYSCACRVKLTGPQHACLYALKLMFIIVSTGRYCSLDIERGQHYLESQSKISYSAAKAAIQLNKRSRLSQFILVVQFFSLDQTLFLQIVSTQVIESVCCPT